METKTSADTGEMFIACLESLEKNSCQLREALMQHNTDAIWDSTSRQEKILEQLTELQTIPGITDNLNPEEIRQAKALATQTKKNQRINRTLTRVFMKIVDSTLNAISNPGEHRTLTYSPTGNYNRVAAPLFVQQLG